MADEFLKNLSNSNRNVSIWLYFLSNSFETYYSGVIRVAEYLSKKIVLIKRILI